ncbi:MAG: ABC transporter ATP-binding protein [Patescibacteria group bacterium]
MSEKVALTVEHLHKEFRLPHERQNSLKDKVLHFQKPTYEKLQALKDINFEVKKGEFFGIVGRNGSGKSTLLKILGGIYQPTKGSVKVNGTLTPFIELGIGFNPELSGRENVFLNGAILGLTRREVIKLYDEIVDFAGIEKFMDQKLKNYSSGMQVRLAFSIAIQAHNDILLIDEVLAVGDAAFQKKCFDVFKSVKKEGKTVIFVTHDMSAVEEYCDRAMLIENSEVISIGKSYQVAREYRRLLNQDEQTSTSQKSTRFGTGDAHIISATILNKKGVLIKRLGDDDDKFLFRIQVVFNKAIKKPIFGITLRDAAGQPLMLSNTKSLNKQTNDYEKDQQVTITWELENIFNTGRYSISPAVAAEDAITMFDWREDFLWLIVDKDFSLSGPIYFKHKINIDI